MKFALVKEHLDFFYQHRYIEFENLLSLEEVQTLKEAVTKILAMRLNTHKKKIKYQSFEELYLAGFDTWRDSDKIKKILFRPQLAEIAAHLVKQQPLRIGFDQAFYLPSIATDTAQNISLLLQKQTALSSTSCLQGIACSLILPLTSPPLPKSNKVLKISTEKEKQKLFPFPKQIGNGIFFSPHTTFSIKNLLTHPGMMQVMITYASTITLYRLCRDDLQTHAYKKLGYVFGDRLNSTTHPVIYQGLI